MSEPPSSLVLLRRARAGVRRGDLERFARLLQDSIARGASFECLITGDRELRQLNREFRGKDYATDVLSFPVETSGAARPGTEPRAGEDATGRAGGRGRTGRSVPPFLGSLAISSQRAAAQAKEHGHSLQQELEILILHGLLHLLGMDHERDRGRMAREEARLREFFQLPTGLIERAGA
jgi:probable rRNA maturation factor